MATGQAVRFHKIPIGNPDAPVTGDLLDRVQQEIQEMAAKIVAPTGPNVVTVTSDYQVKGTEDVIHVDAQTGPVKISLLNPSSANRPLTIKQVNVQGSKTKPNPVTIATRDGSNTIAGIPSFTLGTSGTGSVAITSNDDQHWPDQVVSAPIAPTPANPSGGGGSDGPISIIGIPPIVVKGSGRTFVISETPTPPVPPAFTTPWVAPIAVSGPFSDASGTETWVAEWEVDFTGAPATITLYWWFQAKSAIPGGVFNLRIGGSAFKALDGAVVGTWTEPNSALTGRSLSFPIAAPTGAQPQRVTISVKAPAANQAAQIQGVNGAFR